jgi:hypothetical protein
VSLAIRALVVVLLALGIVAGGVLVWQRWHPRNTGGERVAEAHALEEHGLEVVQPETRPEVQAEVLVLRAQNAELRQALDEALKASPHARPVAVSHSSTGPVVCGGEPRSTPPAASAPGQAGTSLPPAASRALLAVGDSAEVRIDQVALDTPASNLVLVGAASLWRLSPSPETRIFSGPFRAPLGRAAAVEPPPVQPWPQWRDFAEAGAGAAIGTALTVLVVGLAAR